METADVIAISVISAVVIWSIVAPRARFRPDSNSPQRSEIHEYVEKQREFVRKTLLIYLENHECFCSWREFEYWAGKKQGPGWQDNIQNELVEQALKLPFFTKVPTAETYYGFVGYVVCEKCKSKWEHHSEEWRMLAYHERLIRSGNKNWSGEEFGQLISGSIFQTVGSGPDSTKRSLSNEEWRAFMLGQAPNKSKHTDGEDAAGV